MSSPLPETSLTPETSPTPPATINGSASPPSPALSVTPPPPPQQKDYNQHVGILVEEVEHAQSPECFSWGSDRTYKRHICMAVSSGNWVEASSYDKTHPNWVSTPLTANGDAALHIAVCMEQTSFVEMLVERISMQDTEIHNANGNTAFCVAAISGNVEIARVLFGKNPGLVWIRGQKEMLPIQLASLAGHIHMVEFLFQSTQQDMHTNLPFQDMVKLFFLILTSNIYTVALKLLDKYPKLARTENEKGLTALQVIAQSPVHKRAPGYRDMLSSLFKGMEEEESLQPVKISKAMFDAAKSGNVMILKLIFNYYPDLLMEVNSKGKNLLHIAILNRRGRVYRLILSKGASKNFLMQHVDDEGNNVLHLAGKLAAEGRFGSPIHQVLICSEEQWFKEVEKIVPPAFKTMENIEGLTPKELFYREHKRLSEKAVSELNGVANAFLVVATLLITLGITGGLTIRTNNNSGQTPIFDQKTWYLIFLLSVGFGVSFCAISMLLFTSVILPTTWKPKRGYVNSRLIRMTCGCLFLYASVGIMGTVSVTSGAILVFTFFPIWVFYVIAAALCAIPVILNFVFFYYSLHFAVRLIRAFCQQYAGKLLSKMGIHFKLDPVFLD